MNKFSQRVEPTANVPTTFATAALDGIIQRCFFNQTAPVASRTQPNIRQQINLTSEDRSHHPKTLNSLFQTTHHFYTESTPFYLHLSEATKGKNIKLIAVFPTTVEESAGHLNKLGLAAFELKQMPISQLEVERNAASDFL